MQVNIIGLPVMTEWRGRLCSE